MVATEVIILYANTDIRADENMACVAALAGYSYGEMGRIVRLTADRHLGRDIGHVPHNISFRFCIDIQDCISYIFTFHKGKDFPVKGSNVKEKPIYLT